METLFENKYTQDKEWAKDLYSYLYFRRPSIIVLDVLFATYLILGIYNSITTGSVDWYFISIPIVYYASIVFMYCRNVDIAIKRDLELHGKVIEITVTAAEDIIKEIQSTGAEYQLNYGHIKKVVQTKKFIYLLSKTNVVYSFKKDSFSIGTANDFLLSLKNKGIKVK